MLHRKKMVMPWMHGIRGMGVMMMFLRVLMRAMRAGLRLRIKGLGTCSLGMRIRLHPCIKGSGFGGSGFPEDAARGFPLLAHARVFFVSLHDCTP